MSGIAGVLRLDGAPADRDLLARLEAALAPRGPDGTSAFAEGPVGLVHAMLRATPESEREAPLPRHAEAGLVLAWDGRLDNRDEVAAAAAAAGHAPRGDSDADLVLAACAAFGEEAPARLRGDFALALWDGPRRRLLLARDPVGLRPLFHAVTPRSLVFATGVGIPLEDPEVPARPDEGWVAEHLAFSHRDPEATPYACVRRLPPGHLLVAAEGRIAVRRFRGPRFDPEAARLDGPAAATRLRELLEIAVRRRLRSRTTVGFDLSGGLDSTSVAAVAADLVRRGAASDPGLAAQSLVYPGLDCDETPYLRAAAKAAAIPAEEFAGGEAGIGEFRAFAARHRFLPDNPASLSFLPMVEASRRRGIRVRLGGEGGDEGLSADPMRPADFLRSGKVIAALRAAREDGGPGRTLATFWTYGVRPLLPVPARRVLRAIRGVSPPPPWIAPDFARRISLADRVRTEPRRGPWPDGSRAWTADAAFGPAAAAGLEGIERQAADFGFEVRHPFLDLELLEFACSLPRERRVRDGIEKAVLRDAMAGLLPGEVRARREKPEFTALYGAGLRRIGGAASFERLAIAEAGWVEGEWIRRAAGEVLAPGRARRPEDRRFLVVLWAVFALDLWYRMEAARGRERRA